MDVFSHKKLRAGIQVKFVSDHKLNFISCVMILSISYTPSVQVLDIH